MQTHRAIFIELPQLQLIQLITRQAVNTSAIIRWNHFKHTLRQIICLLLISFPIVLRFHFIDFMYHNSSTSLNLSAFSMYRSDSIYTTFFFLINWMNKVLHTYYNLLLKYLVLELSTAFCMTSFFKLCGCCYSALQIPECTVLLSLTRALTVNINHVRLLYSKHFVFNFSFVSCAINLLINEN